MKALVVNNHSLHSDHANEFELLLASLGYANVVRVDRENLKETLPVGYHAVVLSGVSGEASFPVMNHEDQLSNEFELVQAWQKPLIGICYGCQILVRAFGGSMEHLAHPVEQQLITVRLTRAGAELLNTSTTEYTVYSSHKNKIATIPSDLVVLAESDYGPEILVHRTLPFIGIMFHAEHNIVGNEGAQLLEAVFNSITNR